MKKLIISFLAIFIIIVPILGGEEQNQKKINFPSYIIYKSLTICHSAIMYNILQSNPTLRGLPVPEPIVLKIDKHCACVLDEIRKTFTFKEYSSHVYDAEGAEWIENVWRKYGKKCSTVGYNLNFTQPPKSQIPEELPKEESSENEKQENPTGTIFQG